MAIKKQNLYHLITSIFLQGQSVKLYSLFEDFRSLNALYPSYVIVFSAVYDWLNSHFDT